MAGEVPTTQWSETTPAGSDNIALGDNRIREMKTQIREIIDVDHDFPSDAYASDVGQHKQCTFQEQADIGTGAEGVPILGAQTVSGKAELVFTDEDDNDVQLTSGGKLDLGSGRLDNNENLTARNNADDGDINLIKANASDQAEITPALLASGGAILSEISAPATAANQGALYTKNDGTQTELYFREESNGDEVQITEGGLIKKNLGSAVSKSAGTIYQADTDGFLSVYIAANAGTNGAAIIESDGSTPPTTTVQVIGGGTHASDYAYFSTLFPIKKNNYYKVTNSATTITIYFIPIS